MDTTITKQRSTATVGATWPRLAAAAVVAGALLFLVGQALLPSLPDALAQAFDGMLAHRDRLMAARLATSAGSFLLSIGGIGFATVLAPRTGAPRTVRVGAALFAVGAFFNGLSETTEAYATFAVTAPGLDHETGRTVVQNLTAGAVGVPVGFWSVQVFAVGALVMAVGLLIGRRTSRWLPLLLIVGTVLAGALAGRGPVVALTQAPFTVALVIMAELMADPSRSA